MDTKKYIIEIPDNTAWLQWVKVSDKDGHVCFDFKDPEDLTPYIEFDLEQVRKEAYRQGYDTGYGTKVNEFYEQGLIDAWEAARWLVKNNAGVNLKVFGMHFTTDIFCNISASEAIEKIRQYEPEKEEQEKLKKEQSVTAEDVMRQYLDTFCKGRVCNGCPLNTPDFTCGRGYHFITSNPTSNEEVRRAYAKVLQKMRDG